MDAPLQFRLNSHWCLEARAGYAEEINSYNHTFAILMLQCHKA